MTEITLIRSAAEAELLRRFPEAKAGLPGDAAALRGREQAFDLFARRGLPHRRVEAWHYTDLRALMREALPPAPAPGAADMQAARARRGPFDAVEAARVTLIDGHLVPEPSGHAVLPEGVGIVGLARALADGHPLLAQLGTAAPARGDAVLALNAAFMADGLVVHVPAGLSVETPLLVRHLATTDAATFTRLLVVVEAGARLTLVESFEGEANPQSNAVVEIIVGADASVEHLRLGVLGPSAIDLSALGATLGPRARLRSLGVAIGAGLARHQVFVRFDGEGARIDVDGAALLARRQHADTTLVVDHAVPGCESRELFKHVVDDDATGVFQGKIIVRPHAQKTDGRMMSRALLLGEGAVMNNKPELEIFADDVQCGHGATCGDLDETLLFYLRARGIPRPEAEALMIQAFVGEAFEGVGHEGLRDALHGLAESWLRARAG